jgi:hypothetical protein
MSDRVNVDGSGTDMFVGLNATLSNSKAYDELVATIVSKVAVELIFT